MGNDKLKGETSEQTDLGIDALLFAGRMNFSMDYFVKKTKDLLREWYHSIFGYRRHHISYQCW